MIIKLIAMDVDGTLTDGKIYIGAKGEVMKAFNVKDGQGISMLRKAGVLTAIITARQSEIVDARAAELHIDDVCQKVLDKKEAIYGLGQKYGINPEEMVYIGDDIPDISAMECVGVSMCPADAVAKVKKAADYIMPSNGGEGAVRDAAEWILRNNEEAGGTE